MYPPLVQIWLRILENNSCSAVMISTCFGELEDLEKLLSKSFNIGTILLLLALIKACGQRTKVKS